MKFSELKNLVQWAICTSVSDDYVQLQQILDGEGPDGYVIDFVVNGVHLNFDNVIESINSQYDEAVEKKAKEIAVKMMVEKHFSSSLLYEIKTHLEDAISNVDSAIAELE